MDSETPVERTRRAIGWQLGKLGVRNPASMHETILIHNGLFCGRKFHCEEYEVVWFLEEDEIKFFSPVGDLLKISSSADCIRDLDQNDQGLRAA